VVIKCWGARGAIPVTGREFIKYGGDTTCFEIRTKNDDIIIIDAGTGIRRLGNQLLAENRSHLNIIFTHAHIDHLWGLPFFKPLYHKGVFINIYGCAFAQKSTREILSKSMSPPYFPINFNDIKAKILYLGACKKKFNLYSFEVTPIKLSHPNKGLGFKFVEDNRSFVFITDNELTYKHSGGLKYEDYLQFSSGADLLIHDGEFTPEEYKTTKKWGHSVYTDALQLALDAKVKRFGLIHHNQDRTDDQLDKIVEECQQIIKAKKSSLKCFAVAADMVMQL